MYALKEAATELRTAADRLEMLAPQLLKMEDSYTLQQAVEKLGVALTGYWTLSLRIDHCNGDGESPGVEWVVWDGKSNYHAKTLADAVNQALLVHKPGPRPQAALKEACDVLNDAGLGRGIAF